jgi:hypothetical protein
MQYSWVWFVAVICAAGAILFAMGIYVWALRKRVELLQRLFGSVYENSVRVYGSQRDAERALESHHKRLEDCGVHQLSDNERKRFQEEWRSIQKSFSADPANLTVQADDLLGEIMRAQGCPVETADERNLDLTLLYPRVAEKYRVASNVLERQRLGIATFEDRRQIVTGFSDIFDWILGGEEPESRPRKVS